MIIAIISDPDAWADDAWADGLTLPPGFYKTILMKASGTSVNDAWHMIPVTDVPDGFLIITNPHLIGPA